MPHMLPESGFGHAFQKCNGVGTVTGAVAFVRRRRGFSSFVLREGAASPRWLPRSLGEDSIVLLPLPAQITRF